ncbi:hypothetical protein PFISCL1PPCAC_21443, partial [Pristionchus fissidentatus]
YPGDKPKEEQLRFVCGSFHCHFEDRNNCTQKCAEYMERTKDDEIADNDMELINELSVDKEEKDCVNRCSRPSPDESMNELCSSLCAVNFS